MPYDAKLERTPRQALARTAPVIGLLVLAPWVGEYLLGNIPLGALVALPFLVPLYGGGALLIREVARRTGRGYPAILLLGMAYGIVEAGLVDQSLFNTKFDGVPDTEAAFLPVFGLSAYNALSFVVGHAVWSMTVPIAIVEMLTPDRRTTVWLGRKGLGVTVALYLFGCWIIFMDMRQVEAFLASPAQMIGAALAASGFIAAAFLLPKPSAVLSRRSVPEPWIVGTAVFILVNSFFLRPENWTGIAIGITALASAAWMLLRWSRLQGWSINHQFAAVAATLPTYMAAGFVLTGIVRPGDTLAWAGNVIFALIAIGLLVITALRVRGQATSRS